MLLRDVLLHTGDLSIPSKGMINYPCDASQLVTIQPDSSLMIGSQDGGHMKTPPGAFLPPLTILKMCVWISGSYGIFWFRKPFEPLFFQWPALPDQRQWIEGPIAFDADQGKWIPPNSKLVGAWGLRQLTAKTAGGETTLLPDALRCNKT